MSINTTITFMNELTMAQRILLCRRDLDWKQEELSAKSGISRTYISEVERGQITNVGIEVIEALAKALGVSPSYLIGWEENPLEGISEEKNEEPPLTDDETAILAITRQLPTQQRKLLLGIAQLLTQNTEV